ncbi:MAG: peptidylarginine deiminase [Candidatus Delongbacteria bacterium]|nr:peptidylarginine deiminase [Candidatus Delongbacteria bacterium]
MKKYITLLLLITAIFSINFAETKDELAERTAEWFKNNPNSMPHWMTPDELERVGSIGKDFTATPPPTGNVRQTAEFERMQSVVVRYYFGIPMDLVKEMAEVTNVLTLIPRSNDQRAVIDLYVAAGVDTSKCEFLVTPTDSYWTRDYGPWYVVSDNEVGICDFMYNRPRLNDDAVPSEVAPYLSEPYYGMSVVHTGGNYMTDGMGISASTTIVYEESLDQQGISETEVDQRMLDYLGIHTYHVVPDPNNEYIDHIDCWGKFLDIDKILIREVPSNHPQYAEIEATAAYFASQTSSYGSPYEIYRVNTPNDEPYTNSIILNDHVFLPIMNSSNDAAAIAVYEAAMPGYSIVPIPGGAQVWMPTDALHCRTRGVVDKEMLYINHVANPADRSTTQDYLISADINSYGGHTINLADLYYKIDEGSWNSVPMTEVKGTFTASIPQQVNGSVVSYYIHSEDNSGRIENHPFIGSADPHKFNVVGSDPLSAPVNLSVVASSSSADIDWDDVSGANIYIIYRSTDPYSGFTQIDTSPTSDYTDNDVLTGNKYFYRITADNVK